MTDISNLPGVTMDPRDEAGLAAAFGVTSNAEELVKANRARYTPEQLRVQIQDVNDHLTDAIHEVDEDGNRVGLKSDLEDHLGYPVATAVVRGSGRSAAVSYTYVGDRGAIEKGTVPYAEVFGSASEKRAANRATAERDPEAAGQAAAGAKLQEAEAKAADAVREAQDEAKRVLDDARAKAEEAIAAAQAEAAEIRAKAAQEAPAAAEKAEDKAKAAAARGSSSRSK